ncbi:MAG: sarcosine oxidase subunit gamma [Rhodobacteraceae bacterium]|nr:MAG: sarcosine oxidase subunit gamma [Paracoccaceae bacterium]
MVELIAKSACDGLLPKTIGSLTLSEAAPEAITSVTPFRGQEAAVSEALKAQIGAAWPAPNRMTGRAGARVVFSGRGQAFVLGPRIAPIAGAALSDQTDAWASVELSGTGAADALARLVPIDLRPGVFRQGHCARTLIFHMPGLVMHTGQDRYGLMVFRSMARTLVHDLESAMEAIAARG